MTARALSRRRMLGTALSLVPLGGCSLLFPAQAPQLYKLTPHVGGVPNGTRTRGQLAVSTPMASESLNTERIALTRNPTTLDYFAGAAWTDRAPVLLQGLMIDAFEDSDQLTAVGRDSSDINADYRLETVLREFQARYTGSGDSPPTVIVKIDAQLLKVSDRRVVGHMQAEKEVPAAHNSVDSIVEAFDAATSDVIGQIVSWTLRSTVRTR